MSDIKGAGHGDVHNWKRGETEQVNSICGSTGARKSTEYICEDCKGFFRHYYDEIEDIFEAMQRANVSITCNKTK